VTIIFVVSVCLSVCLCRVFLSRLRSDLNQTRTHNLNYYDRLERLNVPTLELRRLRADLLWCYKVVFGLADVNVNEFFEFSPCHNTRGHKYKLFKHQTTACVRSKIFSVNVLSTFGTPCLMMSVLTLFIGFDVVSCVLTCLATLGIVVGLVDFCFLLSILCVLLMLSRLIRN